MSVASAPHESSDTTHLAAGQLFPSSDTDTGKTVPSAVQHPTRDKDILALLEDRRRRPSLPAQPQCPDSIHLPRETLHTVMATDAWEARHYSKETRNRWTCHVGSTSCPCLVPWSWVPDPTSSPSFQPWLKPGSDLKAKGLGWILGCPSGALRSLGGFSRSEGQDIHQRLSVAQPRWAEPGVHCPPWCSGPAHRMYQIHVLEHAWPRGM